MSPLRAARQRAGLSLEALAEKSGVSKATLHNAERDPTRLTDKTAAAVAPFLEVQPKELFRMSIATIDLTETARTITPPVPADRVSASIGVLGGLVDPEDPMQQRALLMMLLASERKPLTRGDEHVALIKTAKGRSFVMVAATVEGKRQLTFMHELEWRLGRGEVEIEVYSRPPQVIQ